MANQASIVLIKNVFIATLGDGRDRPCYGIPLANVDESNHAPNENLELDRFRRGIVTAAAIQCEIAKVALPGRPPRAMVSEAGH